jgi:hypothetical protein
MNATECARRFYFEMLGRELELLQKPEAKPHVERLLRLRPIAEDVPVDGAIRVELALAQRLTDYDIRLDAETGEVISWYLDFLAVSGDESLRKADALEIAKRVVKLPEGAHLEGGAYETIGGRTFFRARWAHYHDGIPVEGDFIEVLVNARAGAPFSMTRFFHQVDISDEPRP